VRRGGGPGRVSSTRREEQAGEAHSPQLMRELRRGRKKGRRVEGEDLFAESISITHFQRKLKSIFVARPQSVIA